jgi:flagellar basal-body rod modification protein FlgD
MTAINSSAAAINQLSGSTSVTNDKAVLDKDGFLKMLVAQMQNQDPSSPLDAAQQTEQMASFTMVEQITNMASQNAAIVKSLNTQSAVGLLGRTVTYKDSDGASQTGKVQLVSTDKDGASTLTVGDKAGIDPTSITSVA